MFQTEVIRWMSSGLEDNTPVHSVVTAFAETMLEPMIERYSLYPAKGTTVEHFAHNSDQMMLSHILNGLFATLKLVYEAQQRELRTLSKLSIDDLKLYVLGYMLHDLDKILGDGQPFHTRTALAKQDAYRKIAAELAQLKASAFFADVADWIPEITWLAINTQRSRNINLSHYGFIPDDEAYSKEVDERFRPQPSPTHARWSRAENTLRNLCTLSDLLAYFIKAPEDAVLSQAAARASNGILGIIGEIAKQPEGNSFRGLSLCYHKLAEVRGLLSNEINNAVMRYMRRLSRGEREQYIPYLFFPNGVVYLVYREPLTRPAPPIDMKAVIEEVKAELRDACAGQISNGTGMGFDGKGRLAYPRYFHDFIDIPTFLRLFCEKARDGGRATTAESILTKMRQMQAQQIIPPQIVLDYTPNERIAKMALFLLNYVNLTHKYLEQAAPQLCAQVEARLVQRLGESLWQEAQQIPSSGGVDYRYYWLAARYLESHPLPPNADDDTGLSGFFQTCIDDLLTVAGEELRNVPALQGTYLPELDEYLRNGLTFGFDTTKDAQSLTDIVGELTRYASAKKQRQSQLSCTLCNSVYTTNRQEDAAVLFQPWVYKNRLPLYKSENAGGICSICSLELMLHQLLLTDKPETDENIRATGTDYEALELKYFFLYPGFFFTQQTFHLIYYIIKNLHNLKLYELAVLLREREIFTVGDLLHLSLFNLVPRELKTKRRNEQGEKQEKESQERIYLFERYNDQHYPGFVFFAKKTMNKKKASGESTRSATASWVEAAWLGMALPLVTGARMVVSEEYLPLFHSAADFKETVVLDAPHQAIRHLLPMPTTRLRLDELYGDRAGDGVQIGGALAALSRAIEVHIDTERSGADLKLERFARIAHDLEQDQLFVFSFLKEQVRREKLEQISKQKTIHYNNLYHLFFSYYHTMKGADVTPMETRHERITKLYLEFYLPFNDRKTRPNSHAIVRPIDVAARCILRDTLNLSAEEIQFEMFSELKAWLEIVDKKGATGRVRVGGKKRDELVWQFVRAFYEDIFLGYAEGQRSMLNNRLNRLRHACEQAFWLSIYKPAAESELAIDEISGDDELSSNGNSTL